MQKREWSLQLESSDNGAPRHAGAREDAAAREQVPHGPRSAPQHIAESEFAAL